MPAHPLPWPYSDWDQRPERHPRWQRGCELYEAYGRFLDRMASGTICEDDGGWACKGIQEMGARDVPNAVQYRFKDKEMVEDSGSYDASFGYTSDAEWEAHRLREKEKSLAAPKVDAAAKVLNDKKMAVRKGGIEMAAKLHEVIPQAFDSSDAKLSRADIEKFLAVKGLQHTGQQLTYTLTALRRKGILVFSGSGTRYGRWMLKPAEETTSE